MDRAKVMLGLTGLQLWLKGQLILIPGHEDLQNALTVCTDALALLKEQETEIRQLRLALDIAKGTCNGIKVEGW